MENSQDEFTQHISISYAQHCAYPLQLILEMRINIHLSYDMVYSAACTLPSPFASNWIMAEAVAAPLFSVLKQTLPPKPAPHFATVQIANRYLKGSELSDPVNLVRRVCLTDVH